MASCCVFFKAIDIFASLTTKFDFQEANCLNQFEHLLTLWRSNCSIVADAQLFGEGDVFNGDLLEEGLEALHVELLDGLQRWRRRLRVEKSLWSRLEVGMDYVLFRRA